VVDPRSLLNWTPWRKGMEAVATAQYRNHHGRSPTVQFGRMPSGYVRSSMSYAQGVKRFKGGPSGAPQTSHETGIAPLGRCEEDSQGSTWDAHQWTAWMPLSQVSGAATGRGSRLDGSWVINNAWRPNQRLELENDLIAGYVLETGAVAAAQCLG
jgi:hypothetical protein